jgi:hypothetical protein
MRALGAGCVKTPTRFHTNLFRSLFRGFRALRIGKIAKNLALLDRLQNFAEFPHGLGGDLPSRINPSTTGNLSKLAIGC